MEDQQEILPSVPIPANTDAPEQDAPVQQSEWEGWWERKGKSPVIAAIIALTAIGAIYFTGQSLLMIPVVLIAKLMQGVPAGDGSIQDFIANELSGIKHPLLALVLLTQFLLLLGPTVFMVRKLHTRRVREYLGLVRVHILDVVLAVCATIAIMPLSAWFGAFFQDIVEHFVKFPEWMEDLSVELFTAHSFPEFIWLALVIGVTPAICEEVLFRGYAQRTMARQLGFKSVWIVGLIFGLYHMQPIGLVSLAMLGVLFGFFVYRSNSIIPSMAAHFTNNFLIVLILYSPTDILGFDIASSDAPPLAWVGISIVATAGFVALYYLATQKRQIVGEALRTPNSHPPQAD